MDDRLSRRRLLGVLGLSSSGLLAGCTGTDDGATQSSEPTETDRPETDTATQTTTKTTEPRTPTDSTGPTIDAFDVATTDTADRLAFGLQATDESGISTVAIESDGEILERFDTPETPVDLSETLTVPGGGERSVTARIVDAVGNSATATRRAYARQYDVLADRSHDIGAIYRPAAGGNWDSCIEGAPAVGEYDVPPAGETLASQFDQAQWAGIDRWVVRTTDTRQLEAVRALSESPLGGAVPVEIAFDPHRALESGTIESTLSAINDHVAAAPAYATRDGRPVVSIPNLGAYDDEREGFYPHPNVTSAFESGTGFVDTLRETLTVDGADPYLVGGLGMRSLHNYETNLTEEYRAFAGGFDALFQDPWDPGEGTVPWETAFQRNSDRLFAARKLADDVGIGFEPVVFPGWDHTQNSCLDSEEVIPRSPDHLAAFLRVADLYGTTGRIRIDSFNDWAGGTQIEPGRAHGTDYGTSYLESVRSFQSTAADRDFYGRTDYYVGPEGANTNPGSEVRPLGTIQHALSRAQPGDTIHVLPGRYTQRAVTRRAGTAENPITITGPEDAVFSAYGGLNIDHSHVHVTGLTFDGLVERSAPDDPESYAQVPISINPSGGQAAREQYEERVPESEYLTDVVVKPHAIGNARAAMIKHEYANDIEIGAFEVIGPAGLKFTLGDRIGHNSEIVYLGTPPGKDAPPDLSETIHVHHIDNSGGYDHAEMVDCKTGISDVTIEYCTDAGGSSEAIADESNGGAVVVGATDVTVRWNVLSNGAYAGIEIDSDIAATENPPEVYEDGGTNNAFYGNRLVGNGGRAISFPYAQAGQGQADQRVVCGNAFDGETNGDPDAPCDEAVPTTDEIGHCGGDSPWTSS